MRPPDYDRYTLEDLLFDDDFRQWVQSPEAHLTAYWEGIQEQYPHLRPLMEQAREVIPALRVVNEPMPEASRERIWAVLEQHIPEATEGRQVAFRPGNYRRLWAVAASVALLILAAGWWLLIQPASMETLYTAFGETRTVTLPDGTVVKLNANSHLTFAPSWDGEKTREVWLEGEAFFVVSKKNSPHGRIKFVAHTPQLDISVLGTQFNVNTRRGLTAVTLVEGKIELTNRKDRTRRIIALRPGQQARLAEKAPAVEVSAVRTEVHDAWTRDLFVFESTPLEEIGVMLYDTYGLEVVFADEDLAEKRFTGNLSRQNLETLLDVLAATYNVEVVQSDRRIEFRRRP